MDRGLRAGFFLDPASFRFRPTFPRPFVDGREPTLVDRIVQAVEANPRASATAVYRRVGGNKKAAFEAINRLLESGALVDEKVNNPAVGGPKALVVAGTPHGTRPEPGQEPVSEPVGRQWAVPGGTPYGSVPPLGTTRSPASERERDSSAFDEIGGDPIDLLEEERTHP
jgi:hypothetical protein